MDRGASHATVHGISESDMMERLSTAQHIFKTIPNSWTLIEVLPGGSKPQPGQE